MYKANGNLNSSLITSNKQFTFDRFINSTAMQVQIDIKFDQLVQLAKRLPKKQWAKLKQEVDAQVPVYENNKREEFKKMLLNGPAATKEQLETIDENRNAINQWRTT